MRGYRVRRPNGTWVPRPILDDAALERTTHRRMAKVDGPVRLHENGGAPGPWLDRGTGTDRFLAKVERGDVGLAASVLNKDGKGVEARVVQVAPTPADTAGSPGVDLLVGFLNAQFGGQWESWGCYVFKHIAGSSTYSDHAYVLRPKWCGRALDVHPHSIAIGDAIHAAAIAEPAIAAKLRYVLWRGVPNHYPGHLHFSFDDGGAPGRC